MQTFAPVVNENVPEDVAENWIDQLTIRTFNEELKDVFPYVYRLVSEVTTATETTPEDFVTETEVEAEVELSEMEQANMVIKTVMIVKAQAKHRQLPKQKYKLQKWNLRGR